MVVFLFDFFLKMLADEREYLFAALSIFETEIVHVVGLLVDTFFGLGRDLFFIRRFFQNSKHVDFLFICAFCSLLFGKSLCPGQVLFRYNDIVELIVEVVVFEELFGLVESAPFDVVVEVDFALLEGGGDLELLLDLFY